MAFVLTVFVVFVLVMASELWWRKRKPHDEFSRKFVHVTVGCFAAFWPYFLSWYQILLLSAAFIAVVLASQYFGIFRAIHAVERPTWGEVCFAAAVGSIALLTHNPAIYTISLLHMALADGVAAIAGTAYGKNNSYRVFGHRKSVAGTLAFLGISLVLLITYGTLVPHAINPGALVGLALVATLFENITVKGLDNLIVPLLVAAGLTLLS